jgi:amylosucrase
MIDHPRQANLTLNRLLPRLEQRFAVQAKTRSADWKTFVSRLNANFLRLFELTVHLYRGQYDYYYHLEELLARMAEAWFSRPAELKQLDFLREADPDWFQSNEMVGGVCYVDLFGGDIKGICKKIPYFKELGLTYLHLMPLFQVPESENDGGYAINSYREVNPTLGTIQELTDLAAELRQNGISLVLDFVFNHTSDQHEWALRAKAGELEYQEYYWMFPDRNMPDAYEATLREIFPDEHPGAFTYFPEINQWVWTTFHSYQWDLNYQNPTVFIRMAEEMLFLANIGVEVLRLDAVAFIWKQIGTDCENLPEAHMLIQAFNAIARIAAPALIFKSEAIVHPDEVIRYISPTECQISYNPLLMALLWETLATRETKLLNQALRNRFALPPNCTWVNYVRVHDDIGWTFSDEDAALLGINGFYHRRFLNDFYTGRFPGSFARGLPFQENPKTGDCRISGTCASLAGLEKALKEETEVEVELAIRRIILIHGIILTIGGIPLLYLGDETGTLNDYSYRQDLGKVNDSRWVHRPKADWKRKTLRHDENSIEGRVFQGLLRLVQLRKTHVFFSGQKMQVIDTGNAHVLGYARLHENERALIFANFSEKEEIIAVNQLRLYGLGYRFVDLVNGQEIPYADLKLAPCQFLCLKPE